jgi:hypothetical protein
MAIMSKIPDSVPEAEMKPSRNVRVSLRISGRTVTRAMFRKPPLVKGIIHDVKVSTDTKESSTSATMAPDMPRDAVQTWALAASILENPDLMRMAKSPTS